MSGSKFIADGLWHCLCPSYSTSAISHGRNTIIRRRRPAFQYLSGKTSLRRQSSQAPLEAAPSDEVKDDGDIQSFVQPLQQSSSQAHHGPIKAPTLDVWAPLDDDKKKLPKPAINTKVRTRGINRWAILEEESTPTLYELARTAGFRGARDEVKRIVEHLVRDRKEAPNLRLYSALILSNVDPETGAAWRVASLLDEMQQEGLTLDVGLCHDVLKVLAVHVDYLLRADILEYMRQRWLELTEVGHHDVAAALIREGQLEMAVDKIEEMRRNGLNIRPWLSDMAIYALAESGEFDEALQLLKNQIASWDSDISKAVWSHLLDTASSAFHHTATLYCWINQVSPGYINPPSGVCLNVLTTASRVGDASLATEAFHVLGKRSTTFKPIHYEQLLATYIATSPPDLRAALTVLTIMTAVKLEPDSTSTRPLHEHLQRNPHACTEVLDILTSLHEAGRTVPLCALNLLIETHVQHRDLDAALTVYKALHTFERYPTIAANATNATISASSSRAKPLANIETFNLLIRGCHRVRHGAVNTALFLAAEMVALGITPNQETYDRLVRVCVEAEKLDYAYRYYDEMETLGFEAKAVGTAMLARRLAKFGDERCWDVLQRMQEKGRRIDVVKADVEKLWTEAVGRKEEGAGGGEIEGEVGEKFYPLV